MPLYNDRFAGHFEGGDLRTPLTGAAGCIWPTVPAFRYKLLSTNATGAWATWNIGGGLVTRFGSAIDHDIHAYTPLIPPPGWSIPLFRKVWNPVTEGYRWEIDLAFGGSLCYVTIRIERPTEKCNRDILIGDRSCPEVPGSSGSTFTAYQLEWDHTDPP